ncbi:hypothetical protein AMECASPLE_035529 [Ameca splendens]|uniref:Uncharacterized protein n=1 Tax=Ameca splendens TaxID=208324 RepID=A0ABV0Z5D5_9TELE
MPSYQAISRSRMSQSPAVLEEPWPKFGPSVTRSHGKQKQQTDCPTQEGTVTPRWLRAAKRLHCSTG